MLSIMKKYFTYKLLQGCGFPYITIEGSIKDWNEINKKLKELKKVSINFFTNEIITIITKIIEIKNGNIDISF